MLTPSQPRSRAARQFVVIQLLPDIALLSPPWSWASCTSMVIAPRQGSKGSQTFIPFATRYKGNLNTSHFPMGIGRVYVGISDLFPITHAEHRMLHINES